MRRAGWFYWQWFKRTFLGAPTAADAYAALAGTILASLQRLFPDIAPVTPTWWWQVAIWLFGAVIVVRFFAAPFAIWKEDQAKLALLETQEHLKAKRAALGKLMEEACQLLDDFRGDADLNELVGQAEDWGNRTVDVLDEQFGPGYRARFLNNAGILSGEPTGMEEVRKSHWRWLNYRTIRLGQILESL